MFDRNSYTRKFTDMMSEGFIFIDSQGKIQIYNNKAKEIFGITYNHGISHDGGRIEKGDIVFLGDSCIGKDDGNLTPEALICMGIKNAGLRLGDAIIAVGRFKGEKNEPAVYKFIKPDYDIKTLELNCTYLDMKISGIINFKNKIISLEVNKVEYNMDYIYSIGHMVVLDGSTKKLKFYKAHGYTARGEGLYDLLKGREYRAKGENSEFFDVIGKDIFEIHKGGTTIEEFYEAATGRDISYVNEFKEINGRPTICTLSPVNDGEQRVGAVLKVEDISEIKKVIRERDEALLNLEQMERRLREEESTKKLLPKIIGESKEITNVKVLAVKASKTNSTVLLLGESGTGKSLLARAIHDISKNRDNPLQVLSFSSLMAFQQRPVRKRGKCIFISRQFNEVLTASIVRNQQNSMRLG